jgi:hypothetical protein
MAVSPLAAVENVGVVKYAVNPLRHRCGPHFTDDLIETDGSHILEVGVARDLGRKLDLLVFKPGRDPLVAESPEGRHVLVGIGAYLAVPVLQHVGGGIGGSWSTAVGEVVKGAVEVFKGDGGVLCSSHSLLDLCCDFLGADASKAFLMSYWDTGVSVQWGRVVRVF